MSVVQRNFDLMELACSDISTDAHDLHDGLMSDLRLGRQVYMRVGKRVYMIKNLKKYLELGYATYKDYVEQAMGMKYQKAEHHRRLWVDLVKRAGINPKEFIDIDSSKANAIRSVITRSNADEWLNKARELTVNDLRREVKQEKRKKYGIVRDVKLVDTLAGRSADNEQKTTERNKDDGSLTDRAEGRETTYVIDGDNCNKLHKKSFYLYGSQLDVVYSALGKAEREAESNKEGHLLSLISLYYLANSPGREIGYDNWVRFLMRKMQDALGGKFLWFRDCDDQDIPDELKPYLVDSELED